MKIIARPRRCGKTAELIKLADGRNGFIVVANPSRAKEVLAMARKLGASIRHPLIFADLIERSPAVLGYSHNTPVYFDDVDLLLRMVAGPHFKLVAATIDASLVDKSSAPVAPELSGT